MEAIKNKRILALVGIICLFIGTIIPYFKISLWGYSYSISLWKYWEGTVIVALIIINTMFIFKDYLQKYVPQVFNSPLGQKIENANSKFAIVPTILVVVFVVYLTSHLDVTSEYIKHGLGFYALWIGVIGLVGHVIFYKKTAQVEQTVEQQPVSNNQPQNNYQEPVQQQPINNSQLQNNYQEPVQQQPVSNNQPQNNYQEPVQQQPVNNNQIQNNYQEPVQQQPMNNVVSQNVKYCPKCGNMVDQNATTCSSCGNNF